MLHGLLNLYTSYKVCTNYQFHYKILLPFAEVLSKYQVNMYNIIKSFSKINKESVYIYSFITFVLNNVCNIYIWSEVIAFLKSNLTSYYNYFLPLQKVFNQSFNKRLKGLPTVISR